MVLDAPDGAARTNGEASSSSSSSLSSSGEEDALPAVLGGFVDDDQPLPRRLLDYATRAAATWCPRQASENAARSLVAWTKEGGAVRALFVLSVSLCFLVRLRLQIKFVIPTDSCLLISIMILSFTRRRLDP
jgi:hypothetical protein